MELWVMDRAGNATSCTATVKVRDLFGYCGQGTPGSPTREEVEQEIKHTPTDPHAPAQTEVTKGDPFILYQNEPNPFLSETKIGFYLPAAATAALSV